ncbi:glycosyltransferase family 39 protein [Lutibacter sp. B1]|uniref:ArnT family glycosyltransferase n=1 Tax=Lutibacter sp. B1 TaxID=2725996 RepID=UPI0014567077|nr:glycosyltransferase family 39 protein [Lutibacter sp. B1]NLP58316.1 glycosyltransferase family 39 protein [Lutibacter sp. B1]
MIKWIGKSANTKLTLLLLITFFISCLKLGSWGLTETSEARYGQISKEMYISKDYVHPKLLGIHHFHKPLLTYHITALGYAIFGVNEFGARFFLQIALIIQLLLVYHISLILFKDKNIALNTSIIYFSLPLVLISVRNLTTDAYLNTCILSSIFFWLKFQQNNHKKYFIYLFFICLGLIMNIKGPVGILFSVIFILIYKRIFKFNYKIDFHVITGFFIFIGMSFFWLALLLKEDPLLFNYFLDEQILKRITTNSYHRAKPIWYYLLVLPLAILPWLIPSVQGIFTNIKTTLEKNKTKKLLAFNIIAIFLIFSLFKTKLILYVLPISSYIAILSSKILSEYKNERLKKYSIFLIILTVLLIVTFFLLPTIDHSFSINYKILSALTLALLLLFLFIYKRKDTMLSKVVYSGYLFGIVLLLGSTLFFNSNEIKINSVKPILNFIENNASLKDRKVVIYDYLLPSASFYSNENIYTISNGHNTVKRDVRFEENDGWKNYLIDVKTPEGITQLDSLLKKDIVLITRKNRPLADNLQSKQTKLNNEIIFGKWTLFY